MAENAFIWSITAASNGTADAAVPFPEAMLPGAVNNSARGLMAGVARLLADINGTITTGGSSNIYTVTSNSGHTALTNGILITAKASFTNTAAASLNLNAYGAKNIRVWTAGAETAVTAGQIISGGRYQFTYDSAADSAAGGWILLNPALPDPTLLANVGDIKIWPTVILPTGYLWCNGAAVSRATYAALFAVIAGSYGVGNGTTTFNVPDLRGRAPFGTDDMGGVTAAGRITNAGSGIPGTLITASGGAESVTLTSAQIPSHTHSGTTSAQNVNHTHDWSGTSSTESATHTHTTSSGQGLRGFDGVHADISYGGSGSSLSFWPVTGTESATHTHTVSGTTGNESAVHTHTVTTDGGTGGGLLHTNMPPALITNYIIKT